MSSLFLWERQINKKGKCKTVQYWVALDQGWLPVLLGILMSSNVPRKGYLLIPKDWTRKY